MMRRVRHAARVVALGLIVAGAACTVQSRPSPVPRAYLFQKGPYQAVYGPDGYLLRLLYDGNGDGVAEVVTVYHKRGRVQEIESDTNLDGAVDRWDVYNDRDVLDRIGTARRLSGPPDLWEYVDRAGAVVRREVDDLGDGHAHRIERFAAGRLTAVELDTDGNAKTDRWQAWSEGRIASESLDTDGDGEPDRRMVYGSRGELLRLERTR